ncbi:hypothetical protein L0664_07940 [Octadecabacter sp. G9-8]|uniref:Uncharacterized protein n=1 Tax=Octadecabacter dasysiphoniae TaxID=2909341 RepID=A0ABS9CY44_9RHOB|nr:hypothetical protein [Octadecabacter dasysiphoniae]MCF2870993.1 hypothetical protein [Octadecabacter dasysiphoniae]
MIVAVVILIVAVIVGAIVSGGNIFALGIGVAVLVICVAFAGTALLVGVFSLVLSDAGVFDALGALWDGFVQAVLAESGPVFVVLSVFLVGYCGLGMLGIWLGRKFSENRGARDVQ